MINWKETIKQAKQDRKLKKYNLQLIESNRVIENAFLRYIVKSPFLRDKVLFVKVVDPVYEGNIEIRVNSVDYYLPLDEYGITWDAEEITQ